MLPTISFFLSEEEYAQLDAVIAETGRSWSEEVKIIVRTFLAARSGIQPASPLNPPIERIAKSLEIIARELVAANELASGVSLDERQLWSNSPAASDNDGETL